MTKEFAERVRSIRAEKKFCVDDELADREIEQCRWERAMANGKGSQSPERIPCDCRESLINGKRVAVHRACDCAYVRERSGLVEAAAMVAMVRVGDPAGDKDRGRVFTRCFAAVMEEFSAPLLRSSSNGAGEHRTA